MASLQSCVWGWLTKRKRASMPPKRSHFFPEDTVHVLENSGVAYFITFVLDPPAYISLDLSPGNYLGACTPDPFLGTWTALLSFPRESRAPTAHSKAPQKSPLLTWFDTHP